MTTKISAGERLDALETGPFHRRLLTLVGAGMFLDGFDVYMAGGVLGSMVKSGESTLALNALFISATFAGMLLGAILAGFIGDRFGRRASYQTNLFLFGGASLVGAFLPNMQALIGARFVMGIGLGAEIVVGYAMLSEFIPAHVRGRWLAMLGMLANAGLLGSALVGYFVIPTMGWRWMFGIVGVGALIVWYLRKAMPESPRWLESAGRQQEADTVLGLIERESGGRRTQATKSTPASVAASLTAAQAKPSWDRLVMGIMVNVIVGTVLYGFVSWIPTFLIKSGASISSSLGYTLVMSLGGPAGAGLAYLSSDRFGRKKSVLFASLATIVFGIGFSFASSPAMTVIAGFCLYSAIYYLLSVSIATYVPELFGTRYRLRSVGLCSAFGRLATVFSPYVIVFAFNAAGIQGVVTFLSLALVLLILTVLLMGVETRGVSLEGVAVKDAPDWKMAEKA
jgi:putative MFS transporter